jgi:hypothetical protein
LYLPSAFTLASLLSSPRAIDLATASRALRPMGDDPGVVARESPRDAKMGRTRTRPVPSGRVSRALAGAWGVGAGGGGVALLAAATTPTAAALGAGNIGLYSLAYTLSKVGRRASPTRAENARREGRDVTAPGSSFVFVFRLARSRVWVPRASGGGLLKRSRSPEPPPWGDAFCGRRGWRARAFRAVACECRRAPSGPAL